MSSAGMFNDGGSGDEYDGYSSDEERANTERARFGLLWIVMKHQFYLFRHVLILMAFAAPLLGLMMFSLWGMEQWLNVPTGFSVGIGKDKRDHTLADHLNGRMEYLFICFWILILYFLFNLGILSFYGGRAAAFRFLSTRVPLAMISFTIAVIGCYYGFNDQERFVICDHKQGPLIMIASLWMPEVILVTLRKGCSKRWPKQVLSRSMFPMFAALTSLSSMFYIGVNKATEGNVFGNTILMGLGFPLFQFALRFAFELFQSSLSLKSKRPVDTGPISLSVELILVYPGFVAMLQTTSDTTFLLSMCLAMLLEVLEIGFFTKLRASNLAGKLSQIRPTNSEHGINSSNNGLTEAFQSLVKQKTYYGRFVTNVEQAEKCALVMAVIFIIVTEIYGDNLVKTIQRCAIAILLETISDVLKELICLRSNIHLSPIFVRTNARAMMAYLGALTLTTTFGLCGTAWQMELGFNT